MSGDRAGKDSRSCAEPCTRSECVLLHHLSTCNILAQPVLLSHVLFALWVHPHVQCVHDAAARAAFCMHLLGGYMHTSDSSS